MSRITVSVLFHNGKKEQDLHGVGTQYAQGYHEQLNESIMQSLPSLRHSLRLSGSFGATSRLPKLPWPTSLPGTQLALPSSTTVEYVVRTLLCILLRSPTDLASKAKLCVMFRPRQRRTRLAVLGHSGMTLGGPVLQSIFEFDVEIIVYSLWTVKRVFPF